MQRTFILILVLMISSLTGCSIHNHYEPYKGKVVDKETREPIAGAAVLAVYYTQSYGVGGSSLEYLDAQETVTDEKGEFNILALNAVTFRPLQSFEAKAWFTIFKPSYGCYPYHKGVAPMFLPNGTLPPKEHVVIELPKITNSKDRELNQSCRPLEVPRTKMNALMDNINIERKVLGFEEF